jgi:site-specific recombinase XerC
MSTLDEATHLFLLDARLDTRAAWTLKKHRHELRRYGVWLEQEHLGWQEIDAAAVRRFARTRSHLSASARGGTFCSLRVFYAWAVDRGYVARSPAVGLKTPKRPRPQPRALSLTQVRQLVAYLADAAGEPARRDEAMLLSALYAGLRACELAKLRWYDLDLDARTLTIALSKAWHGRVLPLHPDLVALLGRWRRVQQPADEDAAVFGSVRRHDHRAITPNSMSKIARKVSRASGVRFTMHILRHTFATWTLRRSHDLYAVSKALGHLGLKQTEIYLSADTEQIAAAVGSLPGLGDW